MPISQYALKDLLQNSLLSSPVVSVSTEDLVGEAANLLPHHVETCTDSVVVVRDEKPVGIVGGVEILEGVLKNPRLDFSVLLQEFPRHPLFPPVFRRELLPMNQ